MHTLLQMYLTNTSGFVNCTYGGDPGWTEKTEACSSWTYGESFYPDSAVTEAGTMHSYATIICTQYEISLSNFDGYTTQNTHGQQLFNLDILKRGSRGR